MEWNISNIKSLTIVGLIVYIILLQECHSRKAATIVTQTSDTSRVTIIDTIPFNDTMYHKISIKIPEKISVYDTVQITETVTVARDTSDTLVYTYFQNIEDSLLKGLLETKVRGDLISNDFSYTAKFPKYIHRIDTIKINTQTTHHSKSFKLSIGAEIGGNMTAFNISPLVNVTNGPGITYSYRYGLINKTHNIGITRVLRFKKQNIINGRTKGLGW